MQDVTDFDGDVVLAFDCCLSAVSVAVAAGGGNWSRQERMTGGQAERLLPLIEDALRDAGLTFGQLRRLKVTLGPGGFTAVRVGIATARGLALALGIPAVGQSSLQALAEAAQLAHPTADRCVTAVPAGRGGAYVQTFSPDAEPLGPPEIVEAPDLASFALHLGDVVVGPAAADLAAGRASALVDATLLPNAARLARSAKHLTRDGELRPIYLRPADAKPQIGKALTRA